MGAIRRAGTAYLSEHLCLHHGFFVVLVLLKLNFLCSASLIIVSTFVLFVLVCVLLVFIRFTAAYDLQTFLQIEIIL
jgi:hypothetical protein